MDDLEREVSGSTPVGAVDTIKRTDGDNDNNMAFLLMCADTIAATLTGNKTLKEMRKNTKINDSLLTGATDLSTQTNMLHTNDIRNKTK